MSATPLPDQIRRAEDRLRMVQRMFSRDAVLDNGKFYDEMTNDEFRDLQRRHAWHKAWVDYGHSLLRLP